MTAALPTFKFPTTILFNTTTDEHGRHLAWTRGYAQGDSLEAVFSYGDWDQDAAQSYDDEMIAAALSEAFELTNILDDPYYADHPRHVTARHYRLCNVRSMCKGDAVKLGDRTFVADSYGWSELHADGSTTRFL